MPAGRVNQEAPARPILPTTHHQHVHSMRASPSPCRSTAYALFKDGGRIWRGGLMQGFDVATWAVIALQARCFCAGGPPPP